MEAIDFTRFFLAFVLVLGLIGAMAFVLKRYRSSVVSWMGVGKENGGGRLQVVETQYLDAKRRLVLVRRDNVEHLLLLADGRETVVEAGIKKIDER